MRARPRARITRFPHHPTEGTTLRRETLLKTINEALEAHRPNVIDVVQVEGLASFKAQQSTIEIQHAEIAQLRMLLRESQAQLRRLHEATSTTSGDYRRLMARIDKTLAATTVDPG